MIDNMNIIIIILSHSLNGPKITITLFDNNTLYNNKLQKLRSPHHLDGS